MGFPPAHLGSHPAALPLTRLRERHRWVGWPRQSIGGYPTDRCTPQGRRSTRPDVFQTHQQLRRLRHITRSADAAAQARLRVRIRRRIPFPGCLLVQRSHQHFVRTCGHGQVALDHHDPGVRVHDQQRNLGDRPSRRHRAVASALRSCRVPRDRRVMPAVRTLVPPAHLDDRHLHADREVNLRSSGHRQPGLVRRLAQHHQLVPVAGELEGCPFFPSRPTRNQRAARCPQAGLLPSTSTISLNAFVSQAPTP